MPCGDGLAGFDAGEALLSRVVDGFVVGFEACEGTGAEAVRAALIAERVVVFAHVAAVACVGLVGEDDVFGADFFEEA